MKIQVIDNKDLERDISSGAIVNTNRHEYEKAISRSVKAREEKERINRLENDINDMKLMLQQIIKEIKKT